MGDIGIIARRLEGGNRVQYGWCGNGGYFKSAGLRLLSWYEEADLVEYLFGLGQTGLIGKPGSENGGERALLTHRLDGTPFYLGESEREIFSQIAFIDYGYFYDLDNTWYYVIPEPFRIKVPLWYIYKHLDAEKYEFEERYMLNKQVATYILEDHYKVDLDFRALIQSKYPQGIAYIKDDVLQFRNPCYRIWENYKFIYDYFDDWILVKTSEDYSHIKELVLKKNQESDKARRIETINW